MDSFQRKKNQGHEVGRGMCERQSCREWRDVWSRYMYTYVYMKNLKEVKETSLMSLRFYIIRSLQETLLLLPSQMIEMWLHTHPQHSVLFSLKNKCMSFQMCFIHVWVPCTWMLQVYRSLYVRHEEARVRQWVSSSTMVYMMTLKNDFSLNWKLLPLAKLDDQEALWIQLSPPANVRL